MAVVATGETVGVGVIRVDFTRRRLLPVFPGERTFRCPSACLKGANNGRSRRECRMTKLEPIVKEIRTGPVVWGHVDRWLSGGDLGAAKRSDDQKQQSSLRTLETKVVYSI